MTKFILVEECDLDEESPGTWFFVAKQAQCVEWTDQKAQAKTFDTLEEAKAVQDTLPASVTIEPLK